MMKNNKKGFTLIELLAVIIILGVLMIIAIPSVTSYIQNSRKSAYVDSAVAYVDAVKNKASEGDKLRFYATDTLYMIPVGHEDGKSCVSVESGGQSPFSDTWNYAYVGVVYTGKGFNYFFIGEDGAGQGVQFLTRKELAEHGTDYIYSEKGDANSVYNTNVAAAHTGLENMYKKTSTTSGTATITHKDVPSTDTSYAKLLAVANRTAIQFVYAGACSNQGTADTN